MEVGAPCPGWWGVKSPLRHLGWTRWCSRSPLLPRGWPGSGLRPDPGLALVLSSSTHHRFSWGPWTFPVQRWAPTCSHPQAVLDKLLGAVPGSTAAHWQLQAAQPASWGLPITLRGAAPDLRYHPPPAPCIPLQACSVPGPGSCWTQGLLHSASFVKPPQTAPPASPGQGGPGAGGTFQGLEGKDPSQRLAPTSAHQDPWQPCWDRKWVWGMFAWGHQTLVGRMGT